MSRGGLYPSDSQSCHCGRPNRPLRPFGWLRPRPAGRTLYCETCSILDCGEHIRRTGKPGPKCPLWKRQEEADRASREKPKACAAAVLSALALFSIWSCSTDHRGVLGRRGGDFRITDPFGVSAPFVEGWWADRDSVRWAQSIANLYPDGTGNLYGFRLRLHRQIWTPSNPAITDPTKWDAALIFQVHFQDSSLVVDSLWWDNVPDTVAQNLAWTVIATYTSLDTFQVDEFNPDSLGIRPAIRGNATLSIIGGPWPNQTVGIPISLHRIEAHHVSIDSTTS